MVKVYGKPLCGHCAFTKNFLTQHGIEFEYIDATKKESDMEMLRNLGYAAFPVVFKTNGEHFGGKVDMVSLNSMV